MDQESRIEAVVSQLPHLDQKKTVYPVVSSRIILT